jgi:hypothetical protein
VKLIPVLMYEEKETPFRATRVRSKLYSGLFFSSLYLIPYDSLVDHAARLIYTNTIGIHSSIAGFLVTFEIVQ